MRCCALVAYRIWIRASLAPYGNPAQLPIAEGAAPAPISPYGFHKWQAEIACQEYARLHGVGVCIARVFSAYGTGLGRQVIWQMTRRLAAGGEARPGNPDVWRADVSRLKALGFLPNVGWEEGLAETVQASAR